MPSISRKRFCYLMILGGNFMLADPSSTREEKVTILSKHIETHKQTRRVGKHRYVPAGERKEYYLQVIFENGTRKKLPVSLSTYNKTRTNSNLGKRILWLYHHQKRNIKISSADIAHLPVETWMPSAVPA